MVGQASNLSGSEVIVVVEVECVSTFLLQDDSSIRETGDTGLEDSQQTFG